MHQVRKEMHTMFEVIYKVENNIKATDCFKTEKQALSFLKKETKRRKLILKNNQYASRDFFTYGLNAQHYQNKSFQELELKP
jgi:hypothetical protein